MDVRSRRARESSPDRVKVYMQAARVKPMIKKVQVVYYLSRNGHLEHPHYMEVTHLANQPLRLRGKTNYFTASVYVFFITLLLYMVLCFVL